jgi:hypothetical protein
MKDKFDPNTGEVVSIFFHDAMRALTRPAVNASPAVAAIIRHVSAWFSPQGGENLPLRG